MKIDNKNINIIKLALIEQDEEDSKKVETFEDNPMEFILKKYISLDDILTELMTSNYRDYLDAVFIAAPKPTTFKIVLHNGQYFYIAYLGKAYEATVSGKKYYLSNIGEKERCMIAISRLLRGGSPLKTKGPEGAEQGTREGGETSGGGSTSGGGEASEIPAAEETGGEEAELQEGISILKTILKEAGDRFERQETSFITTIRRITDEDKIATLKIGDKKITGIVGAEKYGYRTLSGKEPITDVVLYTKKGRINISMKGESAPSLAGGGLLGITSQYPDMLSDFFKKAKTKLSRKFKKGDNIPDIYSEIDKEKAINILRSTKELGGPIHYMYIGKMDIGFTEKGNTITIRNGNLYTPEEVANKYPLYLRYRKRREDQRFDPQSPSLLTRSEKGDSNGRIVITNKVPSTGLLI